MAGHAGVAGRRCRGVGDICIPCGRSEANTGKHHAAYLADRSGNFQYQYCNTRSDRIAGCSDKRRTDAGTCSFGISDRNGSGICTGTADASVPRRGKNRFAVSDYHSGYPDSGHGTNCFGDHRRYRCFPNRHCGDPDILSGGCQYPFRISGNGAGEKRTDVFLCSQ